MSIVTTLFSKSVDLECLFFDAERQSLYIKK